MAIAIDVLAAAPLVWLALRRAPVWISVVIIVAATSPWLFGWISEVDEPDTQPGLLVFGGVLSAALLVAAAVVGRLIRRWIDSRSPH